jgi:hypothetical protein
MTISSWFSAVDQTVSSRTSIEKKRWGLASILDYHKVKNIFRCMMLYLVRYDYSTPLAQKRLYRKMVSEDHLDRFLPTNKDGREDFVVQEKTSDGKCIERPSDEYMEVCGKCIKLFRQVLNKQIDEKQCLKILFAKAYEKCKQIQKEEKGRWFWESSWDSAVDMMSTSRIAYEKGENLEEELENKRMELTGELRQLLDRLNAKQVIEWSLHTCTIPSSPLVPDQPVWLNHNIQVHSQFDARPPVGARILVTACNEDEQLKASVRVYFEGDYLIASCFKMDPMTNDKDPKKHIAEGVVYHLLAEMLLQHVGKVKCLLFSTSEDIQAHDYVAQHYGMIPINKSVLAKLGQYFAHEWTMSMEVAQALVENGPELLECSSLRSPDGMSICLNHANGVTPKKAKLTVKQEGDTLVVTSMKIEPLICASHSVADHDNRNKYCIEGMVYQFLAEFLIQRQNSCSRVIFPHGPNMNIHGEIAENHGLIPPDKEANDEVIAWTMTIEVAKAIAGGRVSIINDNGSIQLL